MTISTIAILNAGLVLLTIAALAAVTRLGLCLPRPTQEEREPLRREPARRAAA